MNLPAADYRCYRHTDREAHIACQRCERLICPECMRDAAVGFQCPACIAEGAKSVRAPRTVAGGKISGREGIASMVFIGLNVAAFALTLATGGNGGAVFQHGAMLASSAVNSSGEVLTGVADGAYWRLLTSAFLHENLLHIAFNLYAIYVFGPYVERALGTARYVVAYLTVAVGASAFVYWLSEPRALTIGASGAVFGLFGMALVFLLKARQDIRSLLVLLAINALLSTRANISWQGHLGGFVVGCLLGLAFAYAPRDRRTLVQVTVLAAMWIGIGAAILLRSAALTA